MGIAMHDQQDGTIEANLIANSSVVIRSSITASMPAPRGVTAGRTVSSHRRASTRGICGRFCLANLIEKIEIRDLTRNEAR